VAKILNHTALNGDAMHYYTKYLVCYDIEDNKKRKKFSDQLKNLGLVRLQKSVFYGELNKAEHKALVRYANELLDPATDKFFWTTTSLDKDQLDKGIGYKEFCYIPPDGHVIL